jgi:2-C-methyl-D-erythritol 4-phosphate cytidylyltransferase
MTIGVIIAAAGTGSRMGTSEKKQFLEIDGQAILKRTVERFLIDTIQEIVVVTGKEDCQRVADLFKDDRIRVVEGGARRQDSIYNGLKVLRSEYVLIHDGARPFISEDLIKRHINQMDKGAAYITAVASKDTIKVVEKGLVKKTLDRSTLYNVQTPQSFDKGLLLQAYKKMSEENWVVTDDASLVEMIGSDVRVIEGSYDNIKITTIEDLSLAELILKRLK